MPKRKKADGTNRVVLYLTDVNFVTVHAVLTPEGETTPRHGVMSHFFNGLVDDWRAKRAKENSNDGSNPNS